MREKIDKTPKQALNSLMALCAKGEKSSGDALRLMTQWGVEKSQQEGVLNQLIENKFIDDMRYTSAYVREKSRLNGWGSYKIKNGLKLKGVDSKIIDKELQTLDKKSAEDRLSILISKKIGSLKESDPYKLKGKLVRYGLGLGYEYDSVLSVIENNIKYNDNEDNDYDFR